MLVSGRTGYWEVWCGSLRAYFDRQLVSVTLLPALGQRQTMTVTLLPLTSFMTEVSCVTLVHHGGQRHNYHGARVWPLNWAFILGLKKVQHGYRQNRYSNSKTKLILYCLNRLQILRGAFKKKKRHLVTSCKKVGGGLVQIIFSNVWEKMTNYKEGGGLRAVVTI